MDIWTEEEHVIYILNGNVEQVVRFYKTAINSLILGVTNNVR